MAVRTVVYYKTDPPPATKPPRVPLVDVEVDEKKLKRKPRAKKG